MKQICGNSSANCSNECIYNFNETNYIPQNYDYFNDDNCSNGLELNFFKIINLNSLFKILYEKKENELKKYLLKVFFCFVLFYLK